MLQRSQKWVAPVAHAVSAVLCGCVSFGLWTGLVLATGFAAGLAAHMVRPSCASFRPIRAPYWTTFLLFIVHRVEENELEFQRELSALTDRPVPSVTSPWLISLLVLTGIAWLSAPWLIKRAPTFGTYAAWSFFASMAVTESWHFVFPFLAAGGARYFPGLLTAALLVPSASWGLYRMSQNANPSAGSQ